MKMQARTSSITILIFCLIFVPGCSGKRPAGLGVYDGRLTACPDKPNCVSSTDAEDNFIEALSYTGAREKAVLALKAVLADLGNNSLQQETVEYLHVEFRSKIMGFVDDVEFYLPKQETTIHVRSASRLGYSDMGVNRQRVEEIRSLFTVKMKKR